MCNCPYCGGSASVAPSGAERLRPETHEIRQCANCNDYYLKHANGRCFPLIDKTDMDSDAMLRVRQ